MRNSTIRAYLCLLGAIALLLSSSSFASDTAEKTNTQAGWITAEDITNPDSSQWASYGRTYSEQRFSPLDAVNTENVDQLGLAWRFPFEVQRGVEATPLVIDGTMYVTSAYSVLYALNAVTGDLIWTFDPQVKRWIGGKTCCGVVSRGVAAWNDKIYLATLDGRLIALDADTGDVVWSRDTVIDYNANYSITGAPRVIDGKVIIGNGGAELGVRGYVSAFNAGTGALEWRFFTVPGDPRMPVRQPIMEMAQKTWFGDSYWKRGGGGTVWDSIIYDPELDLLYIGVGNGSPWNRCIRSECKGDNLFLASVVALNPDTGEYVWHYQETPGDSWDYTSTQPLMLADLMINGDKTPVIMHAPKNGFFYVINAKTGDLISAENYAPVNWAEGYDMETGRPIFTKTADYTKKPQAIMPSPFGAHNWMPMSYNPNTGLVYIPVQYGAFVYSMPGNTEDYPLPERNRWTLGLGAKSVLFPETPEGIAKVAKSYHGALVAWDPLKQEAAWKVDYPTFWNGGTLTTAGNLVFQGTAMADLRAYTADTGELLWKQEITTGVVAPPITYKIDGVQYVTFAVGYGGVFTTFGGPMAARLEKNEPRPAILTFKLGGNAELPTFHEQNYTVPEPPKLAATTEELATGRVLYNANCGVCHGLSVVSGGQVPDLRYLPEVVHAHFADIVKGAWRDLGMPAMGNHVTDAQIELIHQYVIKRSHDLYARVNGEE